MRRESGLDKRLTGDLLPQDIGILLHNLPHQRNTVGMYTARCKRYDCIALLYLRTVYNALLFHDAHDTCGQYVYTFRNRAGLPGSLTAREGAFVIFCSFRKGIHHAKHDCFLNFAAHDAILYGKRFRTHHDAVIHQVIDEVVADRLKPIVLKREQLLRTGLFGLQYEDRVLVAGELAVVERREGSYLVEYALIARFERLSHSLFRLVLGISVDA